MKKKLNHLALIGKFNAAQPNTADHFADMLTKMAKYIESLSVKLSVEHETNVNLKLNAVRSLSLQEIGEQCDCALVVGGDGTMLGVGRYLASFHVPLIGVNQGRVGFITDIPYTKYQEQLKEIFNNQFIEDERSLITARIMRDNATIHDAVAMNDIVVSHGTSSGMVEIRIEVDHDFVANIRADGLIVATPTGSTAYALSAGGPILHPKIKGRIILPIAPHTLSNRPIVVPESSTITIEVLAGSNPSASFDTQSFSSLKIGDVIEVSLAEDTVKFLHPASWSYFGTLREKLYWNTGGSN